jgi:hypothetical protein
MFAKRGWMRVALFAVAAAMGCANAQVLSEGPPPPPEEQKPGFDPSWLPRPIKAGRCDGTTCLLTVRVNGNCDITIDQQDAFISGQNVRILWRIQPGDFIYPEVGGGVEFKSEYNPAWREEFYGSARLDAQTWQWYDANSMPDAFRYTVTVVHKRQPDKVCRIDPGVINDWP